MVGKRAPTAERFLDKFAQGNSDECWNWQANTNGSGYGLLWSLEDKRKVLAHRYSLTYFTGIKLRPNQLVLHSCDNPACVNPAHLRAGSHKDNVADMDARGRRVVVALKGDGNPGSTLKPSEVASLLRDYIAGVPRKDIAAKYRISEYSVSDYTDGKSWTHLHGKHGCPTLEELKAAKRTTPVTEEIAREIWRLHFDGLNSRDIAKTTEQSIHAVEGLIAGKTWRHLPDAPSIESLKSGGVRRGFNQFSNGGNSRDLHPCTKIPSSEIPAILARIDAGETLQAIGKTYGVKKAAIWRIKKMR